MVRSKIKFFLSHENLEIETIFPKSVLQRIKLKITESEGKIQVKFLKKETHVMFH
jgi:hypothetical protein